MQKYDIKCVIGEGAYGVVLKCQSNETKEIVAIKKFKESEEDEIVKKTTMREVKILKMLRHLNIVELKEAFRKKGIVYLVFEYVPNNLLEVLEKSPQGLESELIKVIIYQLLKGLAYMHSLNIVHRDIKLENLLIGDRNELKICDFGFARLLKKAHQEGLTDYVATRWYRPPELLVGASYSKEIDIWAVGCILGELIDGNPMFPGENELDQLFLIQKCLGNLTSDHYETFLKNPRYLGMKFPDIYNYETIEKRYMGKASPKAITFMKQLLKMEPSERLTAVDALKSPYFDGIREQDIIRKLSSNNYARNEGKISQGPPSREEPPKTVSNERKKYATNINPPPLLSTGSTGPSNQNTLPEDDGGIFSQNGRLQIVTKKPREDISKNMTSKGFNQTQSKSVSKAGKSSRIKEKNISLQKHHNRAVIAKTQTGFYIVGGPAIQEQMEEDEELLHTQTGNSANKIYNVKSPKSKQQKRKNMVNTQELIEDQETVWQSNGQLPFLAGPTHPKPDSRKGTTGAPSRQSGMNIIITNSTFNYKHH